MASKNWCVCGHWVDSHRFNGRGHVNGKCLIKECRCIQFQQKKVRIGKDLDLGTEVVCECGFRSHMAGALADHIRAKHPELWKDQDKLRLDEVKQKEEAHG